MTLVISAVNGRGGSGKTTAVILVAGEYALQGKKVLLVDADAVKNLTEWWNRSEGKGNVPAGIDLDSATRQENLETIMKRANRYDVVIFDTPGADTVMTQAMLERSHVVISPIQPGQKEITGAGEAASKAADAADTTGRRIPVAIFRTRVTIVNRNLEEYRLIRPFTEALNSNGYDVRLFDTELMERNCYREIHSGFGTLQMLDLTDPVKKARIEVREFVKELDSVVAEAMKAD